VFMELLHSQALGPELRKVVGRARSLGTTWTYLEDHLREQREKIDHLLSDTLRAGEPVGPEELYRYYRKVCQFLDTKEGESTVSCHVTMDQLDMLLCTLPAEETFTWGRRGDRRPLEDLPDLFYDFCWERAEELRAQIMSTEGMKEEPRVTALPSGYPSWLGPCVLGEICGGHHMPEVCQMFEAMTPEGRLSVIQKKKLCQFCFRHPDTQPCPSQSLAACPIRGCMRMHHRMLHRALLEMAPNSGGRDPAEDLLTSDSKDSTLVTSDEEEGGEPEKSRLCMQMVPVEANGVVQGLHTLYDWGSTVTLVRRESMRRLGFWLAQVAQRLVNGFGEPRCPSLPAAGRREREAPGDLCLRGRGDHRHGRDKATPLGQGGVPIRQGAHAVDGHASGPDRVAYRPGQLAVAASAPGGLQGAEREHATDEILFWPSVHGDGWLGNSTLPQG
jgi:hypothetical protein